jgi:hypothetical protein
MVAAPVSAGGIGSASPVGWIDPATASPATIMMSQTVSNSRVPSPRSASAFALT